MSSRGTLFVISGPSGSGKTSLAERAVEEFSGLCFSVSYTTRPPRDGEQDGMDYHFITKEDFARLQEEGVFLEHARVYGNYYASSREEVEKDLAEGRDVLMDVDIQGGRQVKEAYPDAILVFVMPPSLEALEKRLRERGQDREGVIVGRLEIAKEEIKSYQVYDYVIINEEIEDSYARFKCIVQTARSRQERLTETAEQIIQSFRGNEA